MGVKIPVEGGRIGTRRAAYGRLIYHNDFIYILHAFHFLHVFQLGLTRPVLDVRDIFVQNII